MRWLKSISPFVYFWQRSSNFLKVQSFVKLKPWQNVGPIKFIIDGIGKLPGSKLTNQHRPAAITDTFTGLLSSSANHRRAPLDQRHVGLIDSFSYPMRSQRGETKARPKPLNLPVWPYLVVKVFGLFVVEGHLKINETLFLPLHRLYGKLFQI